MLHECNRELNYCCVTLYQTFEHTVRSRYWQHCSNLARIRRPKCRPVCYFMVALFPYVATCDGAVESERGTKPPSARHYFFLDAGRIALYFFFSSSRFRTFAVQISPCLVRVTYHQSVSILLTPVLQTLLAYIWMQHITLQWSVCTLRLLSFLCSVLCLESRQAGWGFARHSRSLPFVSFASIPTFVTTRSASQNVNTYVGIEWKFLGRWIGRKGPLRWLFPSPNLRPRDFWLCGAMNERVYCNKPKDIQ